MSRVRFAWRQRSLFLTLSEKILIDLHGSRKKETKVPTSPIIKDHQRLNERCSSIGKMLGSILKNSKPFPLRFRPLSSAICHLPSALPAQLNRVYPVKFMSMTSVAHFTGVPFQGVQPGWLLGGNVPLFSFYHIRFAPCSMLFALTSQGVSPISQGRPQVYKGDTLDIVRQIN
jgi:hypothetical protein